MNICYLIIGLGTGGAERYMLNLLPKVKYNKSIISFTNLNDYGKELEKFDTKIYYLGLNETNLSFKR